MRRNTYRVITWGGLGDVVLSTPTFSELKRQDPRCKIIIYGSSRGHREIFYNNPNIDSIKSLSLFRHPYSYFLFYFKLSTFHSANYGFTQPSLFCEKNVKDIIAELFDIKLSNNRAQLFLSSREEGLAKERLAGYKNPIIVHISSRSSKNQEWPIENWQELIRQMPDYTFIQFGLLTDEKVKGAVDFRGKTSFREAMALIKYSLSFVGITSSFSHVTNAWNTPGVVIFGASNPEIWGHSNNINIYKRWRCSPCIDILFRSPCPYSKPCITEITVEEVKIAISQQLKK